MYSLSMELAFAALLGVCLLESYTLRMTSEEYSNTVN